MSGIRFCSVCSDRRLGLCLGSFGVDSLAYISRACSRSNSQITLSYIHKKPIIHTLLTISMYFSSLLFAVTISQSTYSSKQASKTGGFEFLFSGCDDRNGKERESNIESESERERETLVECIRTWACWCVSFTPHKTFISLSACCTWKTAKPKENKN